MDLWLSPDILEWHPSSIRGRPMPDDLWRRAYVHWEHADSLAANAEIDIFRPHSNGKIVEHWNVVQRVPWKSVDEDTML